MYLPPLHPLLSPIVRICSKDMQGSKQDRIHILNCEADPSRLNVFLLQHNRLLFEFGNDTCNYISPPIPHSECFAVIHLPRNRTPRPICPSIMMVVGISLSRM